MRKLSLFLILFLSSCQLFNTNDEDLPVYIVAEQSPIFKSVKCKDVVQFKERKKCADKELLFEVYNNAKYGGDSTQINHPTKMIIEFIITETGLVESTNILQGIEPTLNKSVVNYLKSTTWQPALFEKKPVKFKINLPIQFDFE